MSILKQEFTKRNKSPMEKKLMEKNEVVPFYTDYAMTQFDKKDKKGNIKPEVNNSNVQVSKDFVDSNHK